MKTFALTCVCSSQSYKENRTCVCVFAFYNIRITFGITLQHNTIRKLRNKDTI